jgi:hypothetical protein
MSPLLKEALKRENAFRSIEARKPQFEMSEEMRWGIEHEPEPRKYYKDNRKIDFTNDELKLNWLDGLGVVFVLVSLFLMLNFI